MLKMQIKILGIFFIIFSFVSFGFSEVTAYQNLEQETKTSTLLIQLPIYYLANSYGVIFIHEMTHALAGEILGYDVDRLDVSFSEGRTVFKQRFRNNFDNIFISLVGPASNRIIAWQVNKYLDRNEENMSKSIVSFLAMTYLINRFDFSFYLLRTYAGVVLPGIEPIQSDWDNIVSRLTYTDDIAYYSIFTVFILLDLWDIYRTRKEIVRNYHRVLGKKIENTENSKEPSFKIGLAQKNGTLMLTSRFKF